MFRYKSMKSVKIKINWGTKRVCHRFLPIDRYNRYHANQIYRFLSTVDKLIPIFFDWPLQVYSLRFQARIRSVNARSTCHIDDHKELVGDLSQSENERYFEWILMFFKFISVFMIYLLQAQSTPSVLVAACGFSASAQNQEHSVVAGQQFGGQVLPAMPQLQCKDSVT